MDEGATTEGDVSRVPVSAVLGNGVLNSLASDRVLKLRCGDRDAVNEKSQVERLA